MINILPYGENSVLINFEQKIDQNIHLEVRKLTTAINQSLDNVIFSVIPAYCSITVVYDILSISYESLKNKLLDLDYHNIILEKTNVHKIPVCYEDSFATDIDLVSGHTSLSKKDIVELHTEATYLVYMLGFVPGFLYLGGLNSQLSTPRRANPRLKVPKGSVGIGGNQTGIYPFETPGGWNIIGRSPYQLFTESQPNHFQIGDTVQFYSISLTEFNKLSQ